MTTGTDAGGRRTFSPILLGYLAREFLVPLCCCIAAFVTLFLVRDVFDVLGDFIGAEGVSGRDVALYFLYRQAANIPNILPMSVLLACSFMINMMARHHEVAALRAAGLSVVSCCLPVWITACLLAGVSFWIGERIAPAFTMRADNMENELTDSREYLAKKARMAYQNTEGRRSWFFEHFSPEGEQRGVLLKQFGENDSPEWALQAARAEYVDGVWVFHAGRISRFDPVSLLPSGDDEMFERREMPELDESPARILNRLRPAAQLSVPEMLRILKYNPVLPRATVRSFRTTIWYRLTFPLSCVVAALLGVGMSLGGRESNPLAGFAGGVGLMILYTVASQMLLVLGQNGYLPAFVAGALPTFAFVGWGAGVMYRRR